MLEFIIFPVYKEISMVVSVEDTPFGNIYHCVVVYVNGNIIKANSDLDYNFTIDEEEYRAKTVIKAESIENLDIESLKTLYF